MVGAEGFSCLFGFVVDIVPYGFDLSTVFPLNMESGLSKQLGNASCSNKAPQTAEWLNKIGRYLFLLLLIGHEV